MAADFKKDGKHARNIQGPVGKMNQGGKPERKGEEGLGVSRDFYVKCILFLITFI
jgi:hypothetical protein